jgi:hypothetical protein
MLKAVAWIEKGHQMPYASNRPSLNEVT